ALLEAYGIELLQETSERTRITVVGSRAEEHAVFKLRTDLTKHSRQITIPTEVGWRQVVGLIHHEKIPGQLRGRCPCFRLLAGRKELLEDVRLLEVVIGCNHAGVGSPWICVQTEPLLQIERF